MKPISSQYTPGFLVNGGSMGELIAQKNWKKHPIGPPADWPQSLQTALSICLHSPFPMAVYWSRDLYALYNDAWIPLPGEKHPYSIGQPAKYIWSDVWDIIEEPIIRVFETGNGVLYQNTMLPLQRKGFLEECYFDYTFNPVFGEDGSVTGVINIATETTQRMLHDRRNQTLTKLSEKSIVPESPEAACILIANTLSEAPEDIPFALIYLYNQSGKYLRLAASTSIDSDSKLVEESIDLSEPDNLLPFKKVIKSRKEEVVCLLGRANDLPGGVWDEPAREAVFKPIIHPQTKELFGIIVIGVSPRLQYDRYYSVFTDQLTEKAAFAIESAYSLRRQLQLQSREREAMAQLNAALSTGSIGIWSWNIPENKVVADSNLAKLFGISASQAKQGLPVSDFTDVIHEEDRSKVIKKLQESISKTKIFESEHRVTPSKQAVRWVIARGRVQDDKEGNPIMFSGVAVDITERKLIEQELASSEHMFNALFESSIIGVAVASLSGRVYEANETFLKMFGYQKEDLVKGFYSSMITAPSSNSITSSFYSQLREKGEVTPTEKDYIRKDGSIIPVLVGGVIIPGSDDRFISFMLDISEQKHLIALNKAKDEFISIASHQLRTPATGVKQYIGMLLEGYVGELTKAQADILHTAYESNERQLKIVNDLLRVAQADSEEIKLYKQEVDISAMLNDIINEQKHKFVANNQIITLKTPQKPVIAKVDPLHIRMVFENLIDNANKYTPENRTITIKLTATKNKITTKVKDDGVGIRKKDIPKLFKKFSRINNPLSMAAGGTGLGLYWVKKIVELHQGAVEISSVYKKGSEFTIILPTSLE